MKAILTFHSIDDSESVLSFSPATFERMLNDILRADIRICTLDELVRPEVDNALAITFDDGMQSVFENALPLLRDAKVPSHLYLTTGFVGRDNHWPTQPASAPFFNMMDWSQIEACVDAGMHIENHTISHPDLRLLTESQIDDECRGADEEITKRLGREPNHFAYPYGFYNASTAEKLGQRYTTCVTTVLAPLARYSSVAELPRIDSYYLQHRRCFEDLFAKRHIGYLALRRGMRSVRSFF